MTSSPAAPPFTYCAEGVRLHLRLTPKGSRAVVEGVVIDAAGKAQVKVKVTAPPEKGKANAALIKLLAKSLRLAPSRLELVAGDKDRNKTILIWGAAPELTPLLEKWLEELS